MNLNKILAENMRRFGVKNLNKIDNRRLDILKEMLSEQDPPAVGPEKPKPSDVGTALPDWSKGGKLTWEKAPVKDLVNYIIAKDSSKTFSKFPIYLPIMEWFEKNKKASGVYSSLKNWAGDTEEGLAMKPGTTSKTATMAQTGPAALGPDGGVDVSGLPKGPGQTKVMDKRGYDYSAVKANVEKALASDVIKKDVNATTILQNYIAFLDSMQNNYNVSSFPNYIALNKQLATFNAKPTSFNAAAFDGQRKALSKAVAASIQGKKGAASISINPNFITDDQRAKLLQEAQKQVTKKMYDPKFMDGLGLVNKAGAKMGIGNITIDEVVAAAESITINRGKSGGTFASQELDQEVQSATGEEAFFEFNFSYPEGEALGNADAINNIAQNFFKDEKSRPEPQVIQAIDAWVAKFEKDFTDKIFNNPEFERKTLQIVSVVRRSMSSTSTVRSRYNGIATRDNIKQIKAVDITDPVTGQVTSKIGGVVIDPATKKPVNITAGEEMPLKTKFDDDNNIPLSADRCNSLEKALLASLQKAKNFKFVLTGFPSQYNTPRAVELTERYEHPNNGPGWQSVGGIDKFVNRKLTIKDYGPLFQEAFAKDRSQTPQKFYASRNNTAAAAASRLLGKTVTAQQLTDEYEKTYSMFRTSTCNMEIVIKAVKKPNPQNQAANVEQFAAATYGSFTINLSWGSFSFKKMVRNIKRSISKIDIFPSPPPRRRKPPKKFNTLACPSW